MTSSDIAVKSLQFTLLRKTRAPPKLVESRYNLPRSLQHVQPPPGPLNVHGLEAARATSGIEAVAGDVAGTPGTANGDGG